MRRTSRPMISILAAAAAGILLAACGRTAGASSGNGGSSLTVSARSVSGLGMVLVDGQGRTLYYLPGESASKITCTGACATAWPPFMLPSGDSSAVGGSGVSGTFGTASRPGGGVQITFDGKPLYTFASDTAPGQATGQDVEGFLVAPAAGIGSGSNGSGSTGSSGNRYGGGGGYNP